MIFDCNLDRALWAIMNIDENRDEIAYFINNLPIEIYKDIRLGLSEKFNGDFKIYNKEIKDGNGNIYKYQIDVCNSSLMLKVYKYNNYINKNDNSLHVKNEEYYCLTLNMLYIPLTRNISHEFLGSFLSSSSKTIFKNGVYRGIQCDSSYGNYDLFSTIFGNMVKCKSANGTFYKKIDFSKKMPKEVYLTDFKSNDRVINLVKHRK